MRIILDNIYIWVFISGIAAKDFSSLAKTKDLQPIDIEIEKIKYQTQNIQQVSRRAQSQMRIFENKLDLLSNFFYLHSFLKAFH